MVKEGVEPSPQLVENSNLFPISWDGILSPACLPVPPLDPFNRIYPYFTILEAKKQGAGVAFFS